MITEVVFQDEGRRIPPAVMLSALKFLVFALEQNLTGKDHYCILTLEGIVEGRTNSAFLSFDQARPPRSKQKTRPCICDAVKWGLDI
jgi:hypothetical protein